MDRRQFLQCRENPNTKKYSLANPLVRISSLLSTARELTCPLSTQPGGVSLQDSEWLTTLTRGCVFFQQFTGHIMLLIMVLMYTTAYVSLLTRYS